MAPAKVWLLDSLPVTENGKVDRARLRPPVAGERAPFDEWFYKPVEKRTLRVFQNVLGDASLTARDDFFERGGDSLSAIRVLSELRRTLGVALPFSSLLEASTAARLAELLEDELAAAEPRADDTGDNEPLSSGQERLWFLNQLEPNSTEYNIGDAWHLPGALDPLVLERALNSIVERHEVLRTVFLNIGGQAVQRAAPDGNLKLEQVDLTVRKLSPRDAALRRMLRELTLRPFNLTKDLMLRAVLLRLSEDEHILLLGTHHIASDRRSFQILYSELTELYNSEIENRAPVLPDLPLQYTDVARRWRDWLRSPDFEQQLGYWKRALADRPPVFQLPTDHPRPAGPVYEGGRQSVVAPPSLRASLAALGRREDCTLFMVMLGAFQLLLNRIMNQTDICIGCIIDGRHGLRAGDLIGFFVNTLVLRTDLSGDLSFRELLQRVRTTAMDAFNHHQIPFDRLVAGLRAERDPARNPLVDVAINFADIPPHAIGLRGVAASPLEFDDPPAHVGVTLHVRPAPDGLRLELVYQRTLFTAERMKVLLRQFHSLLEQIAAEPEKSIRRYSVTTAPRSHTEADEESRAPRGTSLSQLFEEQVARTPEAVAAVFEERKLTFGELNRAANQLAHYLGSLGVGPETLVGLCFERSLEMVVALLGILKAGGAYVPLDPNHPAKRLAGTVEDADLDVVVSRENWVAKLPGRVRHVVCLDRDRTAIERGPAGNPRPVAGPGNLAYVIYTSGSTGRPKGVLIEHRSVVNYVEGVSRELGLKGLDGFAMVQPLSVDSSVTAVFPPLLNGGCLHVVSEERALDARALAKYFREHRIDCLKIAPSHLAALHAAGGEAVLPRRVLIVGGEASRWAPIRRYQALAPDCAIFNHYGPTETTVGVTTYPVRNGRGEELAGAVPIGRPLPGSSAHVLDDRMQPVAAGGIGELYVGGECVARGYLNRPEMTAACFVPDPFPARPDAHLYRTGDLVRCLPDGNLEFVGRRDSQVKIRGFRVELGEVESAIARHRGVRDVAVTPDESRPGGTRLMAYVVRARKAEISEDSLRDFLAENVPSHLIPGGFVFVEDLPRTPHGKLDRAALSSGMLPGNRVDRETAPPRDEFETRLARIWEELLDRRPIGVHDNFFALGGHSLLAVTLMARIDRSFGIALPLRVLFEAPTIEQLADVLRRGGCSPRWLSLVPIQPSGPKPPLFCVHAVRGNVLFYADLARRLGTGQPFYGLQSAGVDGRGEPHTRVEEMAAAYIKEMREVQPDGPYLVGGFCSGAYVALEIAHQLQEQGEQVPLLVAFNTDGVWKTVDTPGAALRYHWRKLEQSGPGGILDYVITRSRYRIGRVSGTIIHRLNRVYRSLGRSLPASLLPAYIEDINRRATRLYQPHSYRGTLLYFEGTEQPGDPMPFWGGLVSKIEAHAVPGGEADMFREPHVQVLARQLALYLERAVAGYTGDKPEAPSV